MGTENMQSSGWKMRLSLAISLVTVAALTLVATPASADSGAPTPPGRVGPLAAAPTVTSLSPSSGPITAGTVVTVTGTNLTGATKVVFGSIVGTSLSVVSATQVKVTDPAHAAGVVDVQVTTSGGTSAVVTGDKFTYVAAPTVTSLAPSSGPIAGGTVVTVTGTNLTGATKVVFGSTVGTALSVVSATQVKVTAPAHAAGVVDAQVTTAGGTSAVVAGDKFTYVAAPTVMSLSPSSGPIAGGTVVTVTGTNLTGATAVTFGGTAGTAITVVSATQVKATAPAHAAGAVDVKVTTPYGTSAVVAGDTYTYAALPTVTSVSPTSGTASGGTVVTITGTNLTGTTAVTFGGTAGTAIIVVSATQVKATSPAHVAGAVDIKVTAVGGTSATVAADTYTYVALPAVVSLSPTLSPPSGAAHVTITGTALTGATSVTFGGTAGTGLTVVSSTQISVYAPAHVAGVVDVRVTTPAGLSPIVTADRFTYSSTVNECGTITADTTWTATFVHIVTCPVIVAQGVTLTVAAGTIAKFSSSDLEVASGGTLHAVGSTSSPVIFTAFDDDSVGGDSNGDGTTTSPTTGDAGTVIVVDGGGTLIAAQTSIRYAAVGLGDNHLANPGTQTGVISLVGGSFTHSAYGIDLSSHEISSLTLSGMSFDQDQCGIHSDALTDAISGSTFNGLASAGGQLVIASAANVSGIVFAGTGANTFTGSAGGRRVEFDNSTLPAGKSWTVSSAGGAIFTFASATVGGTLTVAAGTIIKQAGGNGLEVVAGGTLNIAGTSTSPVTATAYDDDSVGGDSNADGTATSPTAGDAGTVIMVDGGGRLTATQMSIRYASVGVGNNSGANPGTRTGVISLSGGSFTNDLHGIDLGALETSSLTVSGVTFAQNPCGIYTDAVTDTISGSTFNGVASSSGQLVIVSAGDVSGVVFTGAGANAFTGPAGARTATFEASKLPAGKSWTLSPDSGAIFQVNPLASGSVGVLVDGTLTEAAGTIVKSTGTGFEVQSGGVLNISGTLASPVTFTAYDDDSAGGDSNADGTATSPTSGDAGDVIVVDAGATVTATQTSIRYATAGISDDFAAGHGTATAVVSWTGGSIDDSAYGIDLGAAETNSLTVSGVTFDHDSTGISSDAITALISDVTITDANTAVSVQSGTASVRGTLHDNQHGIVACNWDTTCTVDAAFIDWGVDGPFPSGGALACGAVTVTPWSGGTGGSPDFWAVANCDGSETPASLLQDAQNAYDQVIAGEQTDCDGGSQDACDAITQQEGCYASAEQLAWSNVTVTGMPTTPPGDGNVAGVVDTWMGTAENPTVSALGDVIDFGAQIASILDLYRALTVAFNSCS